ncbi:YqzL family protein [Zhaonella formicivorans]|nr:YqzL family protein [Zhaonella formicivorans]
MWKIFSVTGYIDAYLYYKDLLAAESEQSDQPTAEIL